ncbi:MAG TPA: hypothetical protein VM782_07625 [Stellaceae bacterium]|nr:hypothetical protein [Stellaceae bacterium]
MGTQRKFTIANEFVDGQLQAVTAAGIQLKSRTSRLVQVMAAYSAENPGFNPAAVAKTAGDASLQNAIAPAWHA